MKELRREQKQKVRKAFRRLMSFLCGAFMLAGGLAVLCGFGMSDTMTAPGAFCMLLSAAGAAAMALGLHLQRRLPGQDNSRTARS